MKIKKYTGCPNCNSRGSQVPRFIVLHIQDGFYDSGVTWMMNPDSQVSSHFLVGKDGQISQIVDLRKAAWTQGLEIWQYPYATVNYVKEHPNLNPNSYCVSIEFSGFYNDFYSGGILKEKGCHGKLTNNQVIAAAELLKHIQREIKQIYRIDLPIDRQHVIGHYEINPINRAFCGKNFPYQEIIRRAGGSVVMPSEPVLPAFEFNIGDSVLVNGKACTSAYGGAMGRMELNGFHGVIGKVLPDKLYPYYVEGKGWFKKESLSKR